MVYYRPSCIIYLDHIRFDTFQRQTAPLGARNSLAIRFGRHGTSSCWWYEQTGRHCGATATARRGGAARLGVYLVAQQVLGRCESAAGLHARRGCAGLGWRGGQTAARRVGAERPGPDDMAMAWRTPARTHCARLTACLIVARRPTSFAGLQRK